MKNSSTFPSRGMPRLFLCRFAFNAEIDGVAPETNGFAKCKTSDGLMMLPVEARRKESVPFMHHGTFLREASFPFSRGFWS